MQLEQAHSDVTYEIEKLTGTLRNYDSLIEYMTVTIDLREVTRETEVTQAPVTLGERIAAQFHSTMAGLGQFGEAVLVFVVGGLPVSSLCGFGSVPAKKRKGNCPKPIPMNRRKMQTKIPI